jgi:N-acetylglucosamine malate deacetylase 1
LCKKILIIAPHPDDETLGAGGTILKHIAAGDKTHWLIITDILPEHGWEREQITSRQKEIDHVAKQYGFEGVHKLGFPTTKLDEIPMREIIASIAAVILAIKPAVIYLQNRSDIHSDHRVAFEAIIACTKSFRSPFIERVLMYETITETDFSPPLHERQFIPNSFVDISKYLEKKVDILKTYKSEMMEPPLPRSLNNVRHLAHYRGSRIGAMAAEAFQLIYERA